MYVFTRSQAGTQIAYPAQASGITYAKNRERGASTRIIAVQYKHSHSSGVAGNFQPISFTAITASVRLVTFSALRIAVT
jgi:hypothetical protein